MATVPKVLTLRPNAPSVEKAIQFDGEGFPYHVSAQHPLRIEQVVDGLAVVWMPVFVEVVEVVTEGEL